MIFKVSLASKYLDACLVLLVMCPLYHNNNSAGQEFVAVFLNTSEPIWEDGSTRNPTKSICDPFVFNTVLTRAKALVVAVGNPFTLLRSEQHMVEMYGQKGRCWSEFLKCCLQNNTLHALNAAMLQRCKARLDSVLFKRTHATSKVEEPQKVKALSQQNPTIPFKGKVLFCYPFVICCNCPSLLCVAASSPVKPKRQEAAPQTLPGVVSTQKAGIVSLSMLSACIFIIIQTLYSNWDPERSHRSTYSTEYVNMLSTCQSNCTATFISTRYNPTYIRGRLLFQF